MFELIAKRNDIGGRTDNDDACLFFSGNTYVFSLVVDAYSAGSSLRQHICSFFEKEFGNVNDDNIRFFYLKDRIESFFNDGFSDFSVGCCLSFYFQVDDNAIYGSIGDTRVYWLSRNTRSIDDSVAQKMFEKGRITIEQIRVHPYRRYITKSVPKYYVLICDVDAAVRGERILLCSDGFWSLLSDTDVFLLKTKEDIDSMPTNTSKDFDNSTLVLFEVV